MSERIYVLYNFKANKGLYIYVNSTFYFFLTSTGHELKKN